MSRRSSGMLLGACLLSVAPHLAGAQGTDDQAIMTANQAFYTALSSRDITAMKAVWGKPPLRNPQVGWLMAR